MLLLDLKLTEHKWRIWQVTLEGHYQDILEMFKNFLSSSPSPISMNKPQDSNSWPRSREGSVVRCYKFKINTQ